MGQSIAEQIANQNAVFLANSIDRHIQANEPNGTAYSEGKKLSFTAPGAPGWAAKMRIEFNLTVTIALGGGTVAASAAAPFNIFQAIKVLYGGVELRNTNGYFYKLLQQTDEHDGGGPRYGGPVTQAYATDLFSTTPVAAGANTWKGFIDVPFQVHPDSVVGLLPMGSSASPVTVTVDCASAIIGDDPFLNPVVITAVGPTATVSGTITAKVYYRFAQSPRDPRLQVPSPVVGSFLKMMEQEDAIVSTSNFVRTYLREPYPHLYVMQVPVVPAAAAAFCDNASLTGARFNLDPGTPWKDYTATGAGTLNLWRDQREVYGQDLDEGVVIWDFISGSDPKNPNGLGTPDIALYNTAETGLLYTGVLAASSNRVVTCSAFMIPVTF